MEADWLNMLVARIPSPSEPRQARGNWAAVELALGTPLPADYRTFISLFGSGVFSDFFWVDNYIAKPAAAGKQLDTSHV